MGHEMWFLRLASVVQDVHSVVFFGLQVLRPVPHCQLESRPVSLSTFVVAQRFGGQSGQVYKGLNKQ